jgi:hypothetical protein
MRLPSQRNTEGLIIDTGHFPRKGFSCCDRFAVVHLIKCGRVNAATKQLAF